jgi:phenylpropionate dioxygenase-like ring-hydroxylating dioxygenase large terminal subunit
MAADARAGRLTPADYGSSSAFERERATFFGRAWIPVCRSDALASAGAQLAVSVAGAPLLVTRDADGALNALSNVCRHRGMRLVDEAASAEVIRCPYHLWTYGLDGALLAAPFMPPDALAGCALPRYRAEEWGGWVFVNLDAHAEPLSEALSPLAARLQPDRLATLKVGFRLAFDHAWNWKVMVENFGESYHHIGPHAQTLQPLWPGGQTDATPSTARWIEIWHPNHPAAGTLEVFVVFPLFLLAITPTSGGAVWYRMTPLAPKRIELEVVGLYPPEAAGDAGLMEDAKAGVLAVHLEDIAVCERVQAGLRSPDAVLGPLSPLEAGVARFREWVAAGGPA